MPNYVTLVSAGGTPVRLADQNGAPYPTTGTGALVYANSPVLINPVLQGAIYTGNSGFGAGSMAAPGLFFATTDRGFFSTGAQNLSAAAGNVLLWSADNGNFTPGANLLLKGAISGLTTLQATGVASGILTLPAATDQLVGRNTTDTLTNKTLTAPIITGASFTSTTFASPTITGTVAGGASYTGPTITGPTITGTVAGGATYSSPVFVTPTLGTPATGLLTNCTGLPVSTGIAGLGANVATFLATASSANLAAAMTDETGTGALVFATNPVFVTPALGTPASGVLSNCSGFPGSDTGGVTTFLGSDVAIVTAGTFVNGPNTGSIGANGQKWKITCCATVNNTAGGNDTFTLRLFDGSTDRGNTAQSLATGFGANMVVAVEITLTGATTFTLQVTDNVGGSVGLLKTTSGSGAANKATSITAERLS